MGSNRLLNFDLNNNVSRLTIGGLPGVSESYLGAVFHPGGDFHP
jgi:hypothetical protein